MNDPIVIVGTDTDVGKTVFAAGLTVTLSASYWKPVQAGLEDGTDSLTLKTLAGLPDERLLPEAYRLNTPASPHIAAEIDNVTIETDHLTIPDHDGQLIIEAAGGLMVPLSRDRLFVDQIADWRVPVVLVGRTALGAINHALLSLAALRARDIPVIGIAFVGDAVPDTQQIICEMGQVRHLGRLPWLDPLTAETLRRSFADNFDPSDFKI